LQIYNISRRKTIQSEGFKNPQTVTALTNGLQGSALNHNQTETGA